MSYWARREINDGVLEFKLHHEAQNAFDHLPVYVLNANPDDWGPKAVIYRRLEFYSLSWLREGDAYLSSERFASPMRVRPGQVVVTTPGVLHAYYGKTARFREAWVAFFGPVADAFGKLGILDPDRPIISLIEPHRIAEIGEMARDGSLESHLQIGLLLQRILVDARFDASHAASNHYPVILELLRQLTQTPDLHLSNDEMAEMCNMGVSRFRKLFRHEVGTSPQRYCERQRMERACDLLNQSPMQIQEIAASLGYDDPLYFSKRFASVLGCSPRAYRQAKGSAPAENTRAISGTGESAKYQAVD